MSDNAQRLFVAVSILSAVPALAGPVNTSESLPAARMNVSGDSVWAGDERIIAHWKGLYEDRRYAVAPFRFERSSSHVYSVGLAEPAANVRYPVAIACSESHAALYTPERKRETPNGTWRELRELAGVDFSTEGAISCAMRPDGSFAILLVKRSVLLTSGGEVLAVPAMGRFARLVTAGSGYALFGANGKVVLALSTSSKTRLSLARPSPFGTPDEHTRFSGNAFAILKADSDSVQMSQFASSGNDTALGAPLRLPVSPCEETQACGVSLATDSTWAVSGYWGTFLGHGKRFVRLSFPNLSRSVGGVAFAHSGRTGSYVYVGNDDGDMGLLPETVVFEGLREEPDEERLAVWHRPGFWAPASSRGRRLFPWKINRKINGHIEQFYENEVTIHEGPIPNPIPRSWVAWEAQEKMEAPRLPQQPFRRFASSLKAFEATWWVRSIHAREAVSALEGELPRPVTVSVVDSGAQMDHPWLKPSLLLKLAEIPDNGIDDDGNGFVDDVSGYDFVDDDAMPQDLYGHGTHVAGLVAARDPESNTPVGVNVATWLRVIRALDARGRSNSIDLARAISYAVTEGTDIMNCSWGGGPATQVLRDAFAYATENNVLVISSAGNDRINSDMYPQVPKMFPGVVSVAATNEGGGLAAFSNWGPTSVAWMAPGENVLSTVRNSQLGEMSGTSMAAPIASNIASLVYGVLAARFPDLRRDQIRELTQRALCETADASGVTNLSRCGRLDAEAALRWARTR